MEEQIITLRDENTKLSDNIEELEQENKSLRGRLSDSCLIEEKLDTVTNEL